MMFKSIEMPMSLYNQTVNLSANGKGLTKHFDWCVAVQPQPHQGLIQHRVLAIGLNLCFCQVTQY